MSWHADDKPPTRSMLSMTRAADEQAMSASYRCGLRTERRVPPTRDDNKSRDVLTKGHRETTTGSTLLARDVVRFLPIIAMQTNGDVQEVYMCRIFN